MVISPHVVAIIRHIDLIVYCAGMRVESRWAHAI